MLIKDCGTPIVEFFQAQGFNVDLEVNEPQVGSVNSSYPSLTPLAYVIFIQSANADVSEKDASVIQGLLATGAIQTDANHYLERNTGNPLLIATGREKQSMVQQLLDKSFDINSKGIYPSMGSVSLPSDTNALTVNRTYGNGNMVDFLIEQGARSGSRPGSR